VGIPLLFTEEFEVVIMIDVVTEEMHGSDRVPDLKRIASGPWLDGHVRNENEMAHSSERRDEYAQKTLDTADIVRDARFHQLCSTIFKAVPPDDSTPSAAFGGDGTDGSYGLVSQLLANRLEVLPVSDLCHIPLSKVSAPRRSLAPVASAARDATVPLIRGHIFRRRVQGHLG
jgi:hypothetical protein